MAVNPPRARLGAFSGGPLGIGWAPWAIGAAALAVGIFFFMRRTPATGQQAQGAAAQPGAMPLTSQPSVNVYPYPTNPPSQTPASSPSAQQMQAVSQAGTMPRSGPNFGAQVTRQIPSGNIFPILPPLVPEQQHPEWTQGWYRTTQGDWVTAGEIYVLPQSNVSASQMANFAA